MVLGQNAIWIGANGEVSFAQGDTSYFYPQLTAFLNIQELRHYMWI
jgi:hypothetical protein